ncbi:MAG: MraY family glycosyltransferase [Coriobacteriia bacterium]|nr:MraY family glycosyltransferase [Coriobacteriia bacterium]
MSWLYCILFFFASVIIVCAMIPVIKWLSYKTGAIDEPSNRRVHKKPTPRLGGVAIFVGIAGCVLLEYIGVEYLGWQIPLSYANDDKVNYFVAAAGVCVMFGLGVVDDIKCLTARTKFIWQFISACIVAGSGLLFYRIMNPFTGTFIEFGLFAYPITVLFLVAFANIINLIDGLDGLASGICLISATTIFIFAIFQNKADAAILSLAIMGACTAFLFFNFHPAKVFMGDSGSLTLGLLLGMASLLAMARTALFMSLLVPILAAGVPILDTVLAILRRTREHKSITTADKQHIHHRLLQSGLSQRQTVLIMWAWTAVLSVCGIVMTEAQGALSIIMFILALGVTIYAVKKLHLLKPILKHHYNPRKKDNRVPRDPTYGIYDTEKPSEGNEPWKEN